MGKSADYPDAPDPAKVIPLQEAANRRAFEQMLQGMRTNEVTPYGTSSWTNNATFDQAGYDQALADWQAQQSQQPAASAVSPYPSDGSFTTSAPYVLPTAGSAASTPAPDRAQFTKDNWTRSIQLSPEQQKLLDGQNAIAGQKMDMTGMLMDRVRSSYENSAIPGFKPQEVSYDATSRQRLEDALLSRFRREMDPQFADEGRKLHNTLSQTGFNIQDRGYGRTMDRFDQRKDRAYADAVDRAVILGGQEASGELGRALEAARFGASENSRERNYAIDDRGRPLNELNAFLSGSQVTMPQTQGQYTVPNLAAGDYQGAYQQQYDNLLGAANANAASGDAFLGGLMGLGGTLLGAPSGSGGAALLKMLGIG